MLSVFWSTFIGVFETTQPGMDTVWTCSCRVRSSMSLTSSSNWPLRTARTVDTAIPRQLHSKSLGNEWTLFWTLRCQRKAWIKSLLAISAQDANNKGSVFTFDEFRKLSTTLFDPSLGIPFPEWVLKRFMAITLLFGALRTEQFNRFREGGLESVEFLPTNIDKDHRLSILSLFVSILRFYLSILRFYL